MIKKFIVENDSVIENTLVLKDDVIYAKEIKSKNPFGIEFETSFQIWNDSRVNIGYISKEELEYLIKKDNFLNKVS